LKREIILTGDGSTTIYLPEWNECYHSTYGALDEANHIFIEAGLKYVQSRQNDIRILEVGFGTGLNAFLTAINGKNYTIYYIGLEPYPVNDGEISLLNYDKLCGNGEQNGVFEKIHQGIWEKDIQVTGNFTLLKVKKKVEESNFPDACFDLVYFDAFAPMVQPEMWQKEIFLKLYRAMKPEGVLVTYSSKGDVKRALKECGFTIEKLPGPKGKREFIRARKLPVHNFKGGEIL
jgi:tRNA U34 5-methylaminomethyl-2-thiouridine-forming methyltransferase MnmC